MLRSPRNRKKESPAHASPYDLTEVPEWEEAPKPERYPRVGAWVGLCGAVLTGAALFLPWTSGQDESGMSIPMVWMFSPAFLAPLSMLGSSIAVGVVCAKVCDSDPVAIVNSRPMGTMPSLALIGAAILGLRALGLLIDLIRGDSVEYSINSMGVGGSIFMIGGLLAIPGVIGAIHKLY